MSKSIPINQTIHGYENGHSLLAHSLDLPPSVRKTMQILSDLSGPSVVEGFDNYITGYPINNLNCYAIAKTWYASEMERPGCVWTHTLLIEFDILRTIRNPWIFIKLLKRPDRNIGFKLYDKPVEVNDYELEESTRNPINNIFQLEKIFYSLYYHPKKSTIVPTNHSSNFEEIILLIWLQQWTNLKKNFSFCTGSITNRIFEDRYFDLQIIPKINLRKFLGNENFSIINENSQPIEVNISKSLRIAFNDLNSTSNLRIFLEDYGNDINASRSSFIPLVNTYLLIKESFQIDIKKYIEWLSNNFSNPNEGIKLKLLLVDSTSEFAQKFDFKTALKELAITNFWSTFSNNAFIEKVVNETIKLWKNDIVVCEELISEIIPLELNLIGENIIEGVAKSVNENDITRISNMPNIIKTFLNKNVNLATYENLWMANPNMHQELLDNLFRYLYKDSDEWKTIIPTILNAKAYDIIYSLVNNLDYIAVNSILNWINLTKKTEKEQLLLNSLKQNPDAILKWLKNINNFSTTLGIYISEILDPNSVYVKQLGLDIWLNLINLEWKEKNQNVLDFMAFILAVGFNNPDTKSINLIRFSFETVYKAASIDNLSYRSWKNLEIHTKSLKWWNDWDKCKKLRRALIDKFDKYDWPLNEFKTIFNDNLIFNGVLQDFQTSKKYKYFINLIR